MYLKLSTIFRYLNATPTSKCFIDGEKLLDAHHLVLCGRENVTEHEGNNDSNEYKIVAYCVRSMAMKEDPHEVTGKFTRDESSINIDNFHCSCKGGASGCCKHVAATLLHCARKPVEELDILSRTDLECQWKKIKPQVQVQYLPQPLFSTRCWEAKIRRNLVESPQEDGKEILAKILAVCPNSALNLHKVGRRVNNTTLNSQQNNEQIPQYLIEISANAESGQFSNDLNIDKTLKYNCCKDVIESLENDDALQGMMCEQGSSEWKLLRQRRLTGTTCYPVYTYNRSTWRKKSKAVFRPKHILTKQMKHGIDHEPVAIEAFLNNNPNFEVKTLGIFIPKCFPWLAYSPDGVIFEHGKPSKLVEIKCPFNGKTESAEDVLPKLPYLNSDFSLKQNHTYYGQIQFGMALLNLPLCEFVVYFSHDEKYLQISVPFDPEFAKKLIKIASEKYFKNMIHYLCLLKEGKRLSDESEEEETENMDIDCV